MRHMQHTGSDSRMRDMVRADPAADTDMRRAGVQAVRVPQRQEPVREQEQAAQGLQRVQRTAEAYPLLENGQQAEVTWTSSNEAVCTVDENGLVTGQGGSGAATVTATCYGMTATCTVYSR